MRHVLSMLMLAGGIAAVSVPASAQNYYAREKLTVGGAAANDGTPTPTPTATPTPAPTTPSVTIKCASRVYQYWAANYNSRPVQVVGRVGNGSGAEKMCQDYASAAGSTGVCAVSTSSADPNNPASGYLMMFYPGDTTTFKDGPAFASEYSMVCTKQ